MLMALMTSERIALLGELTADLWRIYARKWASMVRVVLYDEVQEILTRAVCAWAGVPLAEPEVRRRTAELTALFDSAGAVGPKHWWSRLSRKLSEKWIRSEEHTSELQSLMRISYAVFCLKKKQK